MTGSVITDPLVKFTGDISVVRAYVFSLLSGAENGSSLGVNNLIAGLSRFGSDNPTPSVSLRCGLYGNSIGIMAFLKDASITYSKKKDQQLVVDNKVFTSYGL